MIEIVSIKDNRMSWLKEIDRLKKSTDTYMETNELFSECRIPGIAQYCDNYLLTGMIAETDQEADTFSYQLIQTKPTGMPEIIEASEKGSHLGSKEELISLISLKLHSRFFVKNTTVNSLTDHGIPVRYREKLIYLPIYFKENKPPLFSSNAKNFCDVPEFLDSLKSLKKELHRDFCYAVWNYADGIRWIGIDDDIAFLKLTIAIEILSSEGEELQDELQVMLHELKSEIDPQTSNSSEIKREISAFQKQRRIKASFIKFILKHKTDFFKGRTNNGSMYVTEDNLLQYLNSIYKGRSGYVHEGMPMPKSTMGYNGWEIDPWVEMSIKGTLKTLEAKKMPTVFFFEELVRHCLLQFLAENIAH